MIISQVKAIPKEVPAGAAEPALKRLQPQDRNVLILVIGVLEALQHCEHPACFRLSAELMLAAISQLHRTTKAHLHMQGFLLSPSQMSSFICSLIVLFSRYPDAVRAALVGQFTHVDASRVVERDQSAEKDMATIRSELRNAKILAESCLNRVFGEWISLVTAGKVCSCVVCSLFLANKQLRSHQPVCDSAWMVQSMWKPRSPL